MSSLIRAEQLCKTYNAGRPNAFRALVDVSLEIERGEVVVLRGPSGSGKTTLLGLLGCMARPTSGRVTVAGRDVAKLPEHFLTQVRRRTFGFIFQQFNLVGDISVLDNVLLPLYPERLGFAEMQRRGRALLGALGLEAKQHQPVRYLSGGEQQRVAVARALVGNPEAIIADEPTAHLDSVLSADLLAVLGEIAAQGRTIVIATHDPLVFEHPLVQRRIDMRDGRIAGAPGP